MSEWINVNDRYPEENQIVAFIVDKKIDWYGGSICSGKFVWDIYSDGTKKYPIFLTWGLALQASYWMPLPEAPIE